MKNIVFGLAIITMFATGCSTTSEPPSSSDQNVQETSEKANESSFVVFKSGVNDSNEIYGDSQNYANISGVVNEGDVVYLVDKESGIVHGTSKTSDSGSFNISCNMQGLDERDVIFTNDADITFPVVKDTSAIKNRVDLKFITNDSVQNEEADSEETQESASSQEDTTNTGTLAYSIGDPVDFTSTDGDRVTVTIDGVSKYAGDDWTKPTGPFFSKVDFTVKNNGTAPFDANSHQFEFYDSGDVKSELNSKDFFGETIQAGKSAKGSAYFDVITDGDTFEVFYGDTSWTGNYQ